MCSRFLITLVKFQLSLASCNIVQDKWNAILDATDCLKILNDVIGTNKQKKIMKYPEDSSALLGIN